MIDLHCHSTYSDGTLTPVELLRLAERLGLRAVALTDHDTVAGIETFLKHAADVKVEAIPGVEVACCGPKNLIMHMVGLWCDHHNQQLRDLLQGIRDHRQNRNLQILDRLSDLGCPVEWCDVSAEAGKGVMGRPHFAKALVEKGVCRDHREAFDRFLARGKPAYVRRQLPTAEEALQILSQAGAVCIWAHPMMTNSLTGAKMYRIAKDLIPHGLDGIECFYTEYTEHQTRNALRRTQELGLLASGGSDFHGDSIPGIALGKGRGDLQVEPKLLKPLRKRAGMKKVRAQQARAAQKEIAVMPGETASQQRDTATSLT